MKMNFENIDTNQITLILKTGSLQSLDADHQNYYSMMDVVRGLRAKMTHNGKVITKAGIIKLLKSDVYGLSDFQARKVYSDSINFFYAQENILPEAFANLYAERFEKWADAAYLNGKEEIAEKMLRRAAELRGCYKPKDTTIPEELLNQKPVTIYSFDISDVGVNQADKGDLKAFLDSIPDIPQITMDRVKADAGIKKFKIIERMTQDINEFSEEDSENQ